MPVAELEKRPLCRGRPQQWVVKVGGQVVGLLERWNGRPAQPFHAYAGIGRDARHLGAFYVETVVFANAPPIFGNGGREGAIAAVLAAREAVAA